MFGTNPSNNQLANSQATMRKALANPLMIILAINFLVLTIMALTDLGDIIENAGDIIEFYDGLGAVIVAMPIVQLAFFCSGAIGCAIMFIGAMNKEKQLSPAGAKEFMGAAVAAVVYAGLEIIYILMMLDEFGDYMDDDYTIVLVITAIIMLTHAISMISFAKTLLGNHTADILSTKGAVFCGVMNAIMAILMFIGMSNEESAMTNLSKEAEAQVILQAVLYALLAVYAFYFKATVSNPVAAAPVYSGNQYGQPYNNTNYNNPANYNNTGYNNAGYNVPPQQSTTYAAPTQQNTTYAAPVQQNTDFQPKFCPKCGTPTTPGLQFCGNCGNKLM